MSDYTLDALKAELEEEYAPTTIWLDAEKSEGVVLPNPVRLSKEKRNELQVALKSLKRDEKVEGESEADPEVDVEAEQAEKMREILRIVAADRRLVNKLLKLVGDDILMLGKIVTNYVKKEQVGEASASQD